MVLDAAVFTIVREEPFFLPIWLRYYSRFFRSEDTYVLHHTTSTGEDHCTDGLACHVVTLANDEFDPAWLLRQVSEQQARLLSTSLLSPQAVHSRLWVWQRCRRRVAGVHH